MYLILTECAQSKQRQRSNYRIYCNSKGIPFANGFNAAGWEADRKNKMIREYVREFYAEGQTFFTYKRYNVTTLPARAGRLLITTLLPPGTLIPKPDRELNFL